MKTLVFDSSGDVLAIGIFDGRKKIAAIERASFTRHSEALLPEIRKVFKKARLQPSDIGLIAVGLGPGSFTGLRVGVMAAKTLAYATKAKLVGVSSYEALARSFEMAEGERVAVVGDAKKGLVYAALYEKNKNGLKTLAKPALVTAKAFVASLKAGAWVIGDAVRVYENEFKASPFCKCGPAEETYYPKTQALAELAFERAAKKRFENVHRLRPDYLHAKDCNVTVKKR